jgi:RNA polymerase sigma-70 factor (ECF subfamily)
MTDRPDREELTRMLEEVRPRLELWVASRLGSRLKARVEVDDVVQEVLLKAYEALDGFEAQGERQFYGWLFTIAEHRIADLADRFGAAKRDASREREVHSRIPAQQTTPSMAAARSEAHERMLEAMGRLADRYREILRLRRLEMLSNEEAGRRMEITAKNASVLYARALEALRKEMGV